MLTALNRGGDRSLSESDTDTGGEEEVALGASIGAGPRGAVNLARKGQIVLKLY